MNKKIFSITTLTLPLCIFFLVNALCTEQQTVLKIQPIFNCHLKNSERLFKKQMMPLLEKNNIFFVDRDPDLVLICGSPIQNMHSFKHPHILLDEEEFASASRTRKNILRNPYTIAIFKNTTLRPKSLYNQQMVHHFKLIINDFSDSETINSKSLSQNEQDKIQSVLWDTYRSAFKYDLKSLKELVIDFDAQRPVDVFFAGNILREDNPPGIHRSKLIKQLESIQQHNPNKTIISHIGRLPKDQYLNLLKTSKIAVSPWGNGEWCWRDYEAIYSGAVVIKPDTSFVHAIPDIYCNDKYYVACKPDFSDLEEKISYVIENYQKFTDMRKNARKLLVDHWDHKKIAQDLAQAIKQAFKRYTIVN